MEIMQHIIQLTKFFILGKIDKLLLKDLFSLEMI
jgi:hypothetical protein